MKKWLIGCLMALAMVCLMGMTANAETEKIIHNTCRKCKNTDFVFIRYIPTPISSIPDPKAHWVEGKCTNCGNIQSWVPDDNTRLHTGGDETPTCTTGKTCSLCGAEYGKLEHLWSDTWTAKGDGTHTRPCTRDGCGAVDTANCGGDGSATCVTLGTCTACGGKYYGGHAFPKTWKWGSDPYVVRDAEKHWLRCLNCTEGKAYENAHSFVPGNMYLKSEATCVSKPVYYKNCSACYYKGTEFYEDTNSWVETNPNNHDIAQYEAKAPTCTEAGWKAYEACTRAGCNYTTYQEIPALRHNYWQTIVKPTCEANGYTLYTCVRCKDTYTDDIVPRRAHWYGEWTPNGDGTHSASCRLEGCGHMGKVDCQKIEFVTENGNLVLCPVCGETENGERLELMAKALAVAVNGKLPAGEIVARMKDGCLSIAFEHAGKIVAPTGLVKITLPARLPEGKTLALIAPDGREPELPFEMDGGDISFTLDFTDGNPPVILIRLIQGT